MAQRPRWGDFQAAASWLVGDGWGEGRGEDSLFQYNILMVCWLVGLGEEGFSKSFQKEVGKV